MKDPPAAAAIDTATAAIEPAPPRPPIAIRSLTQYQRDPAFKNFQKKLRHVPGTTASRNRGRADYEARRQAPGRVEAEGVDPGTGQRR